MSTAITDRLDQNLQERIVYLMHLKDVTYRDVDEAQIKGECSVTGRYLRTLVMGGQSPTIRKLVDLSTYFGTSVIDLLLPLSESYESPYEDEPADEAKLRKNYLRSSKDGKAIINEVAELAANQAKDYKSKRTRPKPGSEKGSSAQKVK